MSRQAAPTDAILRHTQNYTIHLFSLKYFQKSLAIGSREFKGIECLWVVFALKNKTKNQFGQRPRDCRFFGQKFYVLRRFAEFFEPKRQQFLLLKYNTKATAAKMCLIMKHFVKYSKQKSVFGDFPQFSNLVYFFLLCICLLLQ